MTNDSGGGRPVGSRGTSHDEALTSSSIIGGAQAVVDLLSLFKTKFAAVLLGPSGVGLAALCISATSPRTQSQRHGRRAGSPASPERSILNLGHGWKKMGED